MAIQYHQEKLFMTPATVAAMSAARQLIDLILPRWAIWSIPHEILHFEPRELEQPPSCAVSSLDLSPYLEFFQQHQESLWGELENGALDAEVENTIRWLHRLVQDTSQPWAYWFHCGDNGLIYEYCLGVGHEPLLHFNECDVEKTSSLTFALRYVGASVPDHTETYWMHGGMTKLPGASAR